MLIQSNWNNNPAKATRGEKKDGHSDTFVFVHVNSFWKRMNYMSGLVWFWWVVLVWFLFVVLGLF